MDKTVTAALKKLWLQCLKMAFLTAGGQLYFRDAVAYKNSLLNIMKILIIIKIRNKDDDMTYENNNRQLAHNNKAA